jgi:enoyl-CoA hydratase/carnithine racemase
LAASARSSSPCRGTSSTRRRPSGGGLINAVVPDDQLDAAVADLVARVTRGSAYSRTLGKRTFYAQIDLDQRAAYDLAVEVMAAAAVTADAQEGIGAFLAKRQPHFTSSPQV